MEVRKAIGLIETRGFAPMVMALDAMTKAANVTFDGHTMFDGLVTAMVSGELSAVKYAIETGEQAARQVGEVVSVKVIATVRGNMAEMLPSGGGKLTLGVRAPVKAIESGEKGAAK
jgi:microcompartment protein CcmL/EutN